MNYQTQSNMVLYIIAIEHSSVLNPIFQYSTITQRALIITQFTAY